MHFCDHNEGASQKIQIVQCTRKVPAKTKWNRSFSKEMIRDKEKIIMCVNDQRRMKHKMVANAKLMRSVCYIDINVWILLLKIILFVTYYHSFIIILFPCKYCLCSWLLCSCLHFTILHTSILVDWPNNQNGHWVQYV